VVILVPADIHMGKNWVYVFDAPSKPCFFFIVVDGDLYRLYPKRFVFIVMVFLNGATIPTEGILRHQDIDAHIVRYSIYINPPIAHCIFFFALFQHCVKTVGKLWFGVTACRRIVKPLKKRNI